MTRFNPFAEIAPTEVEDQELVARVRDGSAEALELLVTRHQGWIYNIVLRMMYHPQDAEDATQEILIKVMTRLSTFEGRSSFRTWLYRIACNHVLSMKRGRVEALDWNFSMYGRGLDEAPDAELPDPHTVPADVQLLVDEARIGCTSGMLLCLNRDQRLVYILGAIFGVTDILGAELMEISRENFRQRLVRARRDLHNFMDGKCGLINAANPCRCAKKTQAFMKAGYIDPANLLFARTHVVRVRDVAERAHHEIDDLDAAYAEIHRSHPFQDSPDFLASVRTLLGSETFRGIVEG